MKNVIPPFDPETGVIIGYAPGIQAAAPPVTAPDRTDKDEEDQDEDEEDIDADDQTAADNTDPDDDEDDEEIGPLMSVDQVAEALGVDAVEVDELLDNGALDGQRITDGRLIIRLKLMKLACLFEDEGTPVDASAEEIEVAMLAEPPTPAQAQAAMVADAVRDLKGEMIKAYYKRNQGR